MGAFKNDDKLKEKMANRIQITEKLSKAQTSDLASRVTWNAEKLQKNEGSKKSQHLTRKKRGWREDFQINWKSTVLHVQKQNVK